MGSNQHSWGCDPWLTPQEAIEVGKIAFEETIELVKQLISGNFTKEDSDLIVHELEDNLNRWIWENSPHLPKDDHNPIYANYY